MEIKYVLTNKTVPINTRVHNNEHSPYHVISIFGRHLVYIVNVLKLETVDCK